MRPIFPVTLGCFFLPCSAGRVSLAVATVFMGTACHQLDWKFS